MKITKGNRYKGTRKIIVNGQEYHWIYIKSKVIIWKDDIKMIIGDHEITGLTPDEVERGKYKRWFSITPKTIVEWIKNNEEIII